MNNPWTHPGSRWWKFDFHTHTPASKDTYAWQKAIGTSDELTPEKWLLKFMAAGIDCVAVTDHNTGAWIDGLKQAYAALSRNCPQGFRELHLFPGVEISVASGLHVLALFDKTAGSETITHLLGAVGFPAHLMGDTNAENEAACTRESLVKVIEEINRCGGIALPAHSDGPSGLLVTESASGKARYADEVRSVLGAGLLGVETINRNATKPQIYLQSGLNWGEVLGSDSHSFQGDAAPGARYTWVKMAQPSLEGLRLALLDGNGVSLQRSDDGAFDPFCLPEHFIESIEIAQTRVMGNGATEVLAFNPGYNALIGGRGTGKSTTVHALRLAFRRDDELGRYGLDSGPRAVFQSFRKVATGRDDEGALRQESEICVTVVRGEVRHRLRWRTDGQGAVVDDTGTDGTWVSSSSQAVTTERFPLRLFSQGQIAAMAGENRQALLDVIDDAAGMGPLHQAFDEAKRAYLALCARDRELAGRLAGRDEVSRKLADAQRKLETFAQSHYADVLQAHQRSVRQRREVEVLREAAAKWSGEMEALARSLMFDDWPAGVFDTALDADILAWRQAAEARLMQVRQSIEQAAQRLGEFAAQAGDDARLVAWRARADAAGQAYETLNASLAERGVHDPREFGRLVQLRQQMENERKRFVEWQADRDALHKQIESQWQRVQEARLALTSGRADFLAQHLSENPYVRIKVVRFGYDPPVIERSLRELIDVTDERFQSDILVVEAGKPVAGCLADYLGAEDRGNGLAALKHGLIEVDSRLGGHFRNYLTKQREKRPEFADHVRCWFPEDDLRIEYSRQGDGRDFVPISQGSAGQRAAALLAFLLAFGDEPLVLDQPEDDLDNHLIYDLIVRQIRENKRRRQIIIITHNPNIVVNGDAEMIHAFEFSGGQCRVGTRGALQERAVRDEVCAVMEGGRDAFARRWARLGQAL